MDLFPFVVLLVTSCFSTTYFDVSLAQTRIPNALAFQINFQWNNTTLEHSHGREIHYHLARALMQSYAYELHRWLPSFL